MLPAQKLLATILGAAVLLGGWLGVRYYLLVRNVELAPSSASAQAEPYPKPQPLPNPEIITTNTLPLAATPSTTGVKVDPKYPLKIGLDFYPAASRKAHEEGRCVVEITVMPDGRISNASIKVGSGSARLDQACLNAVRDGRMLPATEDGKRIEKTMSIALAWKLPG